MSNFVLTHILKPVFNFDKILYLIIVENIITSYKYALHNIPWPWFFFVENNVDLSRSWSRDRWLWQNPKWCFFFLTTFGHVWKMVVSHNQKPWTVCINFYSVRTVNLLEIMLKNRCWPVTFHTYYSRRCRRIVSKLHGVINPSCPDHTKKIVKFQPWTSGAYVQKQMLAHHFPQLLRYRHP